jgi:arylsulfatase A-like enzyme
VPLLVSWPDGVVAPGRVEDGIVELVDLLPTLAEVCGLPVASSHRGESFAPALRDGDWTGRTAALTEAGAGKVLRTDRYRYCVGPDGDERLYDLDADPREHENLAGDPGRADALADCRRRLLTRLTATDLDAARQREWAY